MFEKTVSGKLVNLRKDSFFDPKESKTMEFMRVDLVATVDGEPQCLQLTCGLGVVANFDAKSGDPVKAVIYPKPKNKVGLRSIEKA